MSTLSETNDPDAPGAQEPIDVTPPAPGAGDRVVEGTTTEGKHYKVTIHDRTEGVRGQG